MMKSNADAAYAFVQFGLTEQQKGRRELASGPGSSLQSTVELRELLRSCIREFRITSILDLGCGDWNWMKHVMADPEARNISYAGWDIHEGMIESLQRQFGSPNIQFKTADIFTEPLLNYDLILCRDVLFHVEVQMAAELVSKIMQSASRYFLSTTFPEVPENGNIVGYLPIEGWGFHPVNLEVAPFNLREHRLRCAQETNCSHRGKERYVCLYRIGNDAEEGVS